MMRWLIAVGAAAGLGLLGGATLIRSQEPFPDGAFVRDLSGAGFVVAHGTRYPITWTEDDTSALGMLPEGVAVARIGDVPSPPALQSQVRDRIPIGTPVQVVSESGVSLLITAHTVQDNAQSTNPFNAAKGRWVLVEWRVTNDGVRDRQLFSPHLKLLTADNFVITPGNHAGHPEPWLGISTLGPGQTVRGFIAYDVPAGQALASLIFQPSGARQLVVADIP